MRSTTTRRAGHSARSLLAGAVALVLGTTLATTGHAATPDELQALKAQMQALQNQIAAIEAREGATSTPAPATTNGAAPTFTAGPVTVTLGGFAELIAVDRSRTEGNDWGSNFNTGIPLPNSSNYYLSEFHLTSRQSRLSALAQGPSDPNVAAEAYVETDFGAAPGNANNNESSGYSPRMRHFYGDYQRKDAGWYLLFGQTWSLATLNNQGIKPRTERTPLTIDGQYTAGFSWTREAQLRFVKTFSDTVAVGISLENPATLFSSTASKGAPAIGSGLTQPLAPPTTPVTTIPGATAAYPGLNVSLEPVPDVIAKVAIDPGFGHYEVLGMVRTFRDRFNGANNTTTGAGYGAHAILPLIDKQLELQLSYLGGNGVGRYGSAQLPDVTLNPHDGSLSTIKSYQALAGVTYKPTPAWVLYAYGGTERASEESFSITNAKGTYGYGYGSSLFDNSGCATEGSSATCVANTRSITEESLGAWWKYYQGTLGNAQVGLQLSHTTRDTFAGLSGIEPSTSINYYYLSFRYYPFQK